MSRALAFTLGRNPLARDEQRAFSTDLVRHGLDDGYWLAMNGLVSTGSPNVIPLVLRAWRDGRLAAVAHLVECRRTGQSLFPGFVGRMLDVAPAPIYCWIRGDPAVDLLASPGFVTDGVDRDAFYAAAVGFLNSRYASGSVNEPRESAPAAPCYETPLMDWGHYDVRPGGVEALLAAHGNLRRKISKFRNKGGTLERVSGPLPPADREAVVGCIRQSARLAPVTAPFQENYVNMVRWAAEAGRSNLLHILARLDGAVVGYHAFLRSGSSLQCLSGGFDRTRHSTYHAYENILLDAMRYAQEAGLHRVAFGPIGNASKAAIMPGTREYVLRFYSRFALARRVMAVVIPRSGLRRELVGQWTGLAARTAPGPSAAV